MWAHLLYVANPGQAEVVPAVEGRVEAELGELRGGEVLLHEVGLLLLLLLLFLADHGRSLSSPRFNSFSSILFVREGLIVLPIN